MNLEETLDDSCAEWLNSLLRAPTVRAYPYPERLCGQKL